MNKVTKILGIKYPIISAPMGNISGAALACAVTHSGGLGLIGGGYCDADWIQRQLALATPGQFGIGFITWRLQQFPKVLALALRYNPRAIMLSFGNISPFVSSIKNAGIPLICQVQTIEQAIEAKTQGADILVVQGTEAGGHGADEPLLSLLPGVLNAVDNAVVVAAGGLTDGQDIQNVMALGAQGALMGTRFYASNESLGTLAQKQRIVEARSDETVRTRVFDTARGYYWPSMYTGRALKNAFYQKWHTQVDMPQKITVADIDNYDKEAKKNNFDVAGIFVGEGVGRIKECLAVKEIVKSLVVDAGFSQKPLGRVGNSSPNA